MSNSSKQKILFQLCGSIAAFKACEVISQLVQQGHQVQVVASPSALQFVGEATFEGLTQRPLTSHIFESGSMLAHINWIRWADLIVLCPASAHRLNQLAQGLGDDLIGCIFLAHDFKKPYLIFPAMNTKMLHHPITQASLHKLRNMGLTIFPTEVGTLACGERGEGKLMNTQNILQNISQYLSPSDSTHRRVNILVTAGGTSEPIDKVRVITNRSSGRTGSQIAIRLAQAGHRVTLFRAFNCGYIDDQIRNSPKNLRIVEFDSFESLKALLITQLKEAPYDLIIHSAAVSDFSVDEVSTFSGMNLNPPDKLPSSSDLILKLKRNPKLINRFREWSLPNRPLVIGFKLSCSSDSILRFEDVKRLQEEAKPDFIVSNELSEISEYKHPFTIFRNLDVWSKGETKQELFQSIEAIVNESILKELK